MRDWALADVCQRIIICVFFHSLKFLDQFDSAHNPQGLKTMSSQPRRRRRRRRQQWPSCSPTSSKSRALCPANSPLPPNKSPIHRSCKRTHLSSPFNPLHIIDIKLRKALKGLQIATGQEECRFRRVSVANVETLKVCQFGYVQLCVR